jgi:hypothetical protein
MACGTGLKRLCCAPAVVKRHPGADRPTASRAVRPWCAPHQLLPWLDQWQGPPVRVFFLALLDLDRSTSVSADNARVPGGVVLGPLHLWLPGGDAGGLLRQTIVVGKTRSATCWIQPLLIHCRELRPSNLVWAECQGRSRLAQANRAVKAWPGLW